MSSANEPLTDASLTAGSDILVDGETVPREAQGLAAASFGLVAVLLIALTPLATRAAPIAKGWWVEPRTWPLICLAIVLIASLWQVASWLREASTGSQGGFWHRSAWAFGDMLTALELAGYFCIYMFAVMYFGFALSSFAFMQLIGNRVGLRSWSWRLVAALFVIALVVVFRIGLGIYFPLAPFYEQYASPWFIRTFAIYL